MASLKDQCKKALSELKFPAQLTPIRHLTVNSGQVTIVLDLPPQVALRRTVVKQIRQCLETIPAVTNICVEMTDQLSPANSHPNTSPAGSTPRVAKRTSYLQTYRHVIAVGSGKGGVGKSTLAVNLALALQHLGHQVSLFDADIYGPSLPIMLGITDKKPDLSKQRRIQPLRAYGLSVLSIGNLIEKAAATIWRGPIIHQVLEQLLRDTDWPGGDYMVIDLPPGTGDAPLTLSQLIQFTGAVIISTPQTVALSDAIKALAMFEKVSVPILGMVENMSGFVCPHCQENSPIFANDTVKKTCSEQEIAFLGQIPLDLAICQSGDQGQPLLAKLSADPNHQKTASQQALLNIGSNLLKQLESHENLK